MNEELEQIARDMRKKERELWAGNPPRMGNYAIALMLDGYASRLEVALGLAPRPKGKSEPRLDAEAQKNGLEIKRLRDLVRRLADNLRRYHINGERAAFCAVRASCSRCRLVCARTAAPRGARLVSRPVEPACGTGAYLMTNPPLC